MELATIKSMIIVNKELAKTVASDNFKSYATLADAGYKPARKIAPLAHGYPIVDTGELNKKLRELGGEVNQDIMENVSRYRREHNSTYSLFNNYQNNGKESSTWTIVAATRLNPGTLRPTEISIQSTKLDAYNGLIPPENAQKIADALDSGLFDYIAVWYPEEYEIPLVELGYTEEEAEKERAAKLEVQKQRMLNDPIAVGIVDTKSTSGHSKLYYYIDFWPEDVQLEGSAKWLLGT